MMSLLIMFISIVVLAMASPLFAQSLSINLVAVNGTDYPEETPVKHYLPQELLWRQKEQFSDGVGYQWIDTLRQIAEDNVSEFKKTIDHIFLT